MGCDENLKMDNVCVGPKKVLLVLRSMLLYVVVTIRLTQTIVLLSLLELANGNKELVNKILNCSYEY